MTRHTIDYGIDLGTTNSAIARGKDGTSTLFKSHGHQKDTTPSVVNYDRRKSVRVGDGARNALEQEILGRLHSASVQRNTFLEFKRTMGTDTRYASSNIQRELTSEELSAEVLKELRRQVLDDELTSAVITVPARFQQHQIDATQRAAEAAGFEYCELLQEPIAASLAYGIDSKGSNGRWLVFDFGGGTFDAALMTTDGGLMKVLDTAGDEHLGGKNLDLSVVDHILFPYLERSFAMSRQFANEATRSAWRDLLKFYAEEAKIALATKTTFDVLPPPDPRMCDDYGNLVEIDCNITLEDFERAVRPAMQRAIDITNSMLKSNRMTGRDLSKVVLVGGPTFSQTLRGMVTSEISDQFAVGVDPMTAVARGAAFYASMRQQPAATRTRDVSKVQLTLSYPASTVEAEEPVGILIERGVASSNLPSDLSIELRRADGAWTSGIVMVADNSEVVSVLLEQNRSNVFNVLLYDNKGNSIPCEPAAFSILAGLRVATATMPYNLCIGAFNTLIGRDELMAIRGLEKNQTLPARGKDSFRTQKDIRPGMSGDALKIPLYQGDAGSRTEYNNPLASHRINGEDLPQFLPVGSEVEVVISVDSSRRVSLSLFFPHLDHTKDYAWVSYTQPDPDAQDLERKLQGLKERLASLQEAGVIPESTRSGGDAEIQQLTETLSAGKSESDTRRQVLERFRELGRMMDGAERDGVWPAAERQLGAALELLERVNSTRGTPASLAQLATFRSQAASIVASRKADLASDLADQVRAAHFALVSTDPGYWLSTIKRFDDLFDAYEWSSPLYARQILDAVKHQIFRGTATIEVLESAARELYGLLPDLPQDTAAGGNDIELLRK